MSSLAVGAAALSTAATVAVFGAAPAGASAPARTPSTPMCATSQLSAALGGGDAGAGNLYRYLVLTNHSGTTCHLTGFPGLSMLDAGGKQIGAPATREHNGYVPVVLRPGGSVSDTIHTINHQGTCLPTSAKLRVYPPGNKASLVFPGQITDCHDEFSVTPFTTGKNGNPSSAAAPATAPTTAPSGSGQQVSTVPKGAPDTGLAASSHSTGTGGDTAALAGAGLLAVGGLGVVLGLRRRSRAGARD